MFDQLRKHLDFKKIKKITEKFRHKIHDELDDEIEDAEDDFQKKDFHKVHSKMARKFIYKKGVEEFEKILDIKLPPVPDPFLLKMRAKFYNMIQNKYILTDDVLKIRGIKPKDVSWHDREKIEPFVR